MPNLITSLESSPAVGAIPSSPSIPVRPVLSLAVFGRDTRHCGSVLEAGRVKTTFNARAALALALRHAKIGRGDSVLIPAYHCPAMVSPLAWLDIQPVFYPICPDTSVDIEALAHCLKPETRALLAVHYFGFIRDMRLLRAFCDQHGLVLIEDCAHAFFGNIDGQALGGQGDYAIASVMKFLPIDQGGCLVSAKHSLEDIETRPGGIFAQLKSAVNTVEFACEYGRLPWIKWILQAKDWVWGRLKPRPLNLAAAHQATETCMEEGGSPEDYIFDPRQFGIRMPWTALAIMRTMSFSRACARRRANYLRLLAALRDIPGARPLFAELPEGAYPQVFPMVMDAPETAFAALKRKGVPIIRFGEFRWKGVDASLCPVADEYSRRVFQFPCHQSLTDQEISWLIEAVQAVLKPAE
ncbi:MAG: DegT/DnrJ/EryC1/StrS family aminotransferase [Candidatus Methylumidiphilus sp.]